MSNRHPKQHNRRTRPKKKKAKTIWSLPTVFGLVLTAVGLISLRPQITVSSQEQLTKGEMFSSPFRVENAGYLGFHIMQLTCYIHEIRYPLNMMFSNEVLVNEQPPDVFLERQESETIQCPYLSGQMPTPERADVVIVVDYRPLLIPWTFRRYFRFIGASGDTWQWLSEPASQVKNDVDNTLSHDPNKPPYRSPLYKRER